MRRRRRRRVFPPRGCVTRGTAQIRFSSLNALSVLALQARCSLQESRRRPSARFIAFPPGFVSFSRFVSPFISPPAAPRRAPLSFSLSLSLCCNALHKEDVDDVSKTQLLQLLTLFVGSRHPCIFLRACTAPSPPSPRPLCPRITPIHRLFFFLPSFLPSSLLSFFASVASISIQRIRLL